MTRMKAQLFFTLIILGTLQLTCAQPWNNRLIGRTTSEQDKLAGVSVDRRDKLIAEYESQLALKDAIQELFNGDHASSGTLELGHSFAARGSPWTLPVDIGQLQEKLDQLNASLQALMQLLQQEYGSPTMSTGSAPSATLSAVPVVTTPAASTPSSSPAYGGPFNPMSSSNNAVYYAQTDATSRIPLSQLCSDPNIDIVILAFVTTLFGPNGWPVLNMGSHCWAANAAQQAAGATGLIDCVGDGFAEQVHECQSQGKRVMLSVGGAIGYSDTTIPSEERAVEVAGTLWDLFLGGGTQNGRTNETAESIRPYGDVVLDGIDIDNEDPENSAHMTTLMSTLRTLFTTDASKTYYLSAAPQCPRPNASIALPAMQQYADFIWVQFYNNPSCNLNTGQPFQDALKAWSYDLINGGDFRLTNNNVTSPRLYVGAPAFAAAGSGFVQDGAEFRSIMEDVENLGLSNIGGVMWWDGAYEVQSAGTDGVGVTYARIVKETLGGGGT